MDSKILDSSGFSIVADAKAVKSVAASPVIGYRGPYILAARCRKCRWPRPPMKWMSACRGLDIDGNDFGVAHQVYRRLEDNNDVIG